MPAASGEARDGNFFGVGIGVLQSDVEGFGHVHVEWGESGDATEVELADVVVAHTVIELPHSDPFHIHGQHAVSGLVNAADLFVGGGFAFFVVSIDVENDRDFLAFGEVAGDVQEGGAPPAGENLEAEFLDGVVGVGFEEFFVNDAIFLFVPKGGQVSSEYDFFQDVFAELVTIFAPFFGVLDVGYGRDSIFDKASYLFEGSPFGHDGLVQRFL